MIKFLMTYWRDILAVVVFIISVVLALIRKKPVLNELDNILVFIDDLLPGLINDAESFKGSETKLALVIESVKKAVKKRYGVSLDSVTIDLVKSKVEDYLSTPQKKGGPFNG